MQETQADKGSILGSGRSLEVGNGNPLLYSCLNPMDRRAWKAAVHMVAESDTTERTCMHAHIHNAAVYPCTFLVLMSACLKLM